MHMFFFLGPALVRIFILRETIRVQCRSPTTLQCVAVCCSVLQSVAACCSVLQCVAIHTQVPHIYIYCTPADPTPVRVLANAQCGVVYCSVLQCGVVYCSVLQCGVV